MAAAARLQKGRARCNASSPAFQKPIPPRRTSIPSALFSRHDSARIPVKMTNSAQRAFSRHGSGGAPVKKDTPSTIRFLPLPWKRFPAPAGAAGTTKPQISGFIPPSTNSKHSVFPSGRNAAVRRAVQFRPLARKTPAAPRPRAAAWRNRAQSTPQKATSAPQSPPKETPKTPPRLPFASAAPPCPIIFTADRDMPLERLRGKSPF